MKKWKAFFFFCAVLLLSLTLSSCTMTRTEYVPLKLDLTDVVQPVLDKRPDNSTLTVYAGPIYEDWQVLRNSQTYLYAWEMWQTYAEGLEDTINEIVEQLK